MDETYVGGSGKPGPTGRGATGKTVVAGAIERVGRGFGRARLQIIPDASGASLAGFLRSHVSPGSVVVTDGWSAYPAAIAAAEVAHEVHTVAASGEPAHLRAYLDEFVFSFNRRRSRKRSMPLFRLLEAAVAGSPAPYKDIAVVHRKPLIAPIPRDLPRILTGQPIERPWRAA